MAKSKKIPMYEAISGKPVKKAKKKKK